jgi:hypothetical protein
MSRSLRSKLNNGVKVGLRSLQFDNADIHTAVENDLRKVQYKQEIYTVVVRSIGR